MCHITRDIVLFNTSVTVVLSSLAICGLSLERYVACIHSFRLYRIFTKERILFCSLCASFIGLLLGIISITLRDKNSQEVILEDNKPLRVMSMIIFICREPCLAFIIWNISVRHLSEGQTKRRKENEPEKQ